MGPILEVIGRTLVVYVAIVVGLRVVGKRQLGQLTVPDLVVVLLIANAVQNAMVGADVSLGAGLVSAATLLVANLVVTRVLVRSPQLARLVASTPTVLVKDGAVLADALRHEGIDEDELRTALREHGVEDPSHVRVAYLEPDGAVSVVPMDARVVRTRHRVRRQRDR
jgi:uncharacterized membrane protein YcaP (DUF421 family)